VYVICAVREAGNLLVFLSDCSISTVRSGLHIEAVVTRSHASSNLRSLTS
jgi:hypothetical protein